MCIDINFGTSTVSLHTVKVLLNSVISTPGATFVTIDIKAFYLNTYLATPEFLRMKFANFPDNGIGHYQLKGKVGSKCLFT